LVVNANPLREFLPVAADPELGSMIGYGQ
jgi:hypothetical protein